jgi:hypothetical protein
MREILLDSKQPYGVVTEHKMMPGHECDYGYSKKVLGPNTVRNNNGATHGPSFADKAPNALNVGHRNLDNPFAWTGHPGK